MPSKKGNKRKSSKKAEKTADIPNVFADEQTEPEDKTGTLDLSDLNKEEAQEIGIIPTEPKPNKKLEALVSQLADKKSRLSKYLKQQGLGQNAIRKVFELVNEINVVRDDISKEE